MYLVNKYVGHENATTLDVGYHGNLILPLMLEAYKLLIAKGLVSLKSLVLVLFHLFLTQMQVHLQRDCLERAIFISLFYPIDAKTCNCALTWWCIEEPKFPIVAILLYHRFWASCT